ncbi:UNVERIFIED_CONTAM: hypothetical protein PYX00_009126 [Menopon gallinae]|uniref:Uncharacterized protein n=1 Tax=Menopon gallinae TaxID=328185 RepID=A0AAW2H9X1_9NEOP
MGNCTSKKSEKLLKSTTAKKPILKIMDKDQDNNNTKGLTKKVAPFTKGEVTSFGFRRKPNSSLPVPVTLTSNGNVIRDSDDKKIQNGILKNKEIIDDSHSGSSVESLCHHAPLRPTPKMIRKKDSVKQTRNSTTGNNINNNNVNQNNENIIRTSYSTGNSRVTFSTVNTNVINQSNNANNNHGIPPANRFGFRQQKPSRLSDSSKAENAPERRQISNLGPYDTGTYRVVKKGENVRSKSEGPREAFFKQTLQPAGSVQSVLGQSKTNISNIPLPGKFTLQTSHLPRPQFPVRMPDAKTAKTVTNYYRRGGPQSDSNSSKEGSLNDDSGFETQSATNTSKHDDSSDSPGFNVRRRLQSAHGKKLEMKIVGNKFELLDKSEEKDPTVVTEVSLIKLPMAGVRASTAIINTGLVEQRTNQYLKRISQSNKKDYSTKIKDTNRLKPSVRVQDSSSDSSHLDEGFGAESEEEKLFKDRNGTEKSSGNYLMNDAYEDEEMLPGEAMAEDVSLSFSSDDETSAVAIRKKTPGTKVNIETDVTPNTIRLDALKLSKQLKSGAAFVLEAPKNVLKVDDSLEVGDDETFPSESILEQISSDTDSFGDKGENKDGKKNLEDDIEIEELEEDNKNLKNIDLEISDSELNVDEKDIPNNVRTPESPGTPTNASNSLSLSEGRDFLIDDEIADQPQLCLTETYPDCSCQEEAKTCNDKTLTSSGNNNEFLSCAEGATLYKNEATQAVSDSEDGELANIEANRGENVTPAKRERRLNSAGTLSPCDSLTSDDLMMDFESSVYDDTSERVHSGNGHVISDELSGSKTTEDTVKDIRSQSSQKSGVMSVYCETFDFYMIVALEVARNFKRTTAVSCRV